MQVIFSLVGACCFYKRVGSYKRLVQFFGKRWMIENGFPQCIFTMAVVTWNSILKMS